MAHGVGPDDLGGALDVYAAETRGAVEERIGAEAEAGSDGAAHILAAPRDHFKLGGGAEVDHDARAAESLVRSDGVSETVCAEFGGIVDEHGHAGLDAGLDEHGFDFEIEFTDLAERGVDRRHNGSDDDVRDLLGGHAVHLKEIDEEDAVLIHGLGAMGGDAPMRGEFRLFSVEPEEAEDRVGISDIESKQHVGSGPDF